MTNGLSDDVIWSLQALAQAPHVQRELYPNFAVVADQLVLDFDHAYSEYKKISHTVHADLESLDAHIAKKSGILEFWTEEALDRSEFWNEIRQIAKVALEARSLPTSFPPPSPDTYASDTEVWRAGRIKEAPLDGSTASLISRKLKRFR